MTPAALYVGKVGETEVLITVWPDGTADMAVRSCADESWGPPIPLEQR